MASGDHELQHSEIAPFNSGPLDFSAVRRDAGVLAWRRLSPVLAFFCIAVLGPSKLPTEL